MRNLDDFYYLTEFIDSRIEAKTKDTNSQIAKVLKTDGNVVDCELVKSQEGLAKIEKIPIVQSKQLHYPVKEGDFGLLLNIGQIPGEFFTLGTIKTSPLNLPFYVFLPLITKIEATSEMFSKDNFIIQDSEKENIIKMDKEGTSLTVTNALKIETKTTSIIASEDAGVDINESKLGSTLEALSKDLKKLKDVISKASIPSGQVITKVVGQATGTPNPNPISLNLNWEPSSISDLEAIANKIQ